MQPLVSILIPVYNAERWLAETVDSAVSQTWTRKEIILVDDGSTDESLALARQFESEIVKVVAATHRGQTATLNTLLSYAQGDFIQYLDADDLLAEDKIEIQANRLLEESKETACSATWMRFYHDDVSTATLVPHPDFRDYDQPLEWLIDSWNGRGTMPPVAWLFPRELVTRAGQWNEELSLHNDTEYFTRIIGRSRKIAYCPTATGFYRSGNQTLSSKRDRKSIESFFKVCELSVAEMLSHENSERTRHACASLWQFFVYQTYPQSNDLVRRAEENVSLLNGSNLEIPASPSFKRLASLCGWKTAKRLQVFYHSVRS